MEGEDLEWAAKNNLAYVLALGGQKRDAERAMRLVQELSDSPRTYPTSLLLTKGAVVARFAPIVEGDPVPLLERTLSQLEELRETGTLDRYQSIECELVLKELRVAIEAAGST